MHGKKGMRDPLLLILLGIIFAAIIFFLFQSLGTTPNRNIVLIDVQGPPPAITDEEEADLRLDCQAACDAVIDEQSALAYCSRTEQLDTISRTRLAARLGTSVFCTQKVPCFVTIENCKGYTPASCKELLLSEKEYLPLYLDLIQNVDSDRATPDDGCGLPTEGGEAAANWKVTAEFDTENPTGS